MKKTRKQKIESEKRREKFLYSLESLNLKKETIKTLPKESPKETSVVPKESKSHVLPLGDYSYLRRDLTKILIFCAFALGVQIVLHLTLL